MRKLRVLFFPCAVLLGGCAAASVLPSTNLAQLTFTPQVRSTDNGDADRVLARAREAWIAGQGRPEDMRRAVDLVAPHVAASTAAAEFVVFAGLARGTLDEGDARHHLRELRERSLRTLIDAGQFRYLPRYWEEMVEQPALGLTVFSVSYAVPATRYVAENEPTSELGAWAQLRAAKYWLEGCPTTRLSRHAPKIDDGRCVPRADLAVRYAQLFAANSSVPPDERLAVVQEIQERIAILEALSPSGTSK